MSTNNSVPIIASDGDKDELRRIRINEDLVKLCKHRPHPNSTASLKGIGLYTHVANSSGGNTQNSHENNQSKSDPNFLSLKAPSKVTEEELKAPISADVVDVWHELKNAMNQEEKHMRQGGYSIGQLKKRYGALEAPSAEIPSTTNGEQVSQMQAFQEEITRIRGGINNISVPGSVPQNAAAPAQMQRRKSTYDVARDPRRMNRNV